MIIEAMASNLIATASILEAMASIVEAMASILEAVASNLRALATFRCYVIKDSESDTNRISRQIRS